jgi:ABC-type multidrug transport system ATPase subunit
MRSFLESNGAPAQSFPSRRLVAEDKVTTFLSSHDAQEVRSLCGEISVIDSGRVVDTGATRELGADLDTFEWRLIELLAQQHSRA